jgi:hypothetical protein
MAKSNDREHFEDYRHQTQVKHEFSQLTSPPTITS